MELHTPLQEKIRRLQDKYDQQEQLESQRASLANEASGRVSAGEDSAQVEGSDANVQSSSHQVSSDAVGEYFAQKYWAVTPTNKQLKA